MVAPTLPAERPMPHCGYFTGETTPAGCQLLMRRYKAAINVATAATLLANHVKRSLNVGPLSTAPAHEAKLWAHLREMLDRFNKEAATP